MAPDHKWHQITNGTRSMTQPQMYTRFNV